MRRGTPQLVEHCLTVAWLDGEDTVQGVLAAEVLALRAERDNLQVQVTQWELTAVREGILCRGDIE